MKKVLILEDFEVDFEAVYKGLQERYGKQLEIFPTMEGSPQHKLSKWEDLRDTFREGTSEAFGKIFEAYPDIDLFIIDVNFLVERVDGFGDALWNAYKSSAQCRHEEKVIFLTANSHAKRQLNKNEIFVSKSQIGRDHVYQVIEHVRTLLQIEPKPLGNKYDEDELAGGNSGKKLKPLGFFARLRYFPGQLSYAVRQWTRELGPKITFWIDLAIKGVFMVIIGFALFFGVVNVYRQCVEETRSKTEPQKTSPVKQHSTSQQVTSMASDTLNIKETPVATELKKEEPAELAVAESIFLSLLPVFIVFGFYIYYKSNISIYLTSGNIEEINDAVSTRAMGTTKSLFIGSLISYLSVKTIDLLFYAVPEERPPVKLVEIGILLVILMSYFFLLEKLHHPHRSKEKQDGHI